MNSSSYTCTACNLILPENNKTSHDSGKKHRNNLQRLGLEVPPLPPLPTPPDNTAIIVNGYPGYTNSEDLIKVFSKFGSVTVQKSTKHFAVLRFETVKMRDDAVAIDGKIILYGSYLKVRPYKDEPENHNNNKREFPHSKQKEYIVPPSTIDFSGDFHQQCQAIFAAVRLTREQVERISLLYSHLTELFQHAWPGCVAVPFGSITTGLGIKSSDADCFVDIPPRFRDGNHVSKAKRLLASNPKVFTEVIAIPRANTPIVKFFHIPTDTNCDVSFKTPLGARNSALLAFLLRGDPRILHLCILVKYWAKIHNFTGTGRLSNYALTMLVIFFLQQQQPPLLPSVKWLQSGLSCFIDGWNTAFADQCPLVPPIPNTSTLDQLIGAFFVFYAKFNFAEIMICPYLGVAIPKKQFEKIQDVPNDFDTYKSMVGSNRAKPLRITTEMCVQDPFEQAHNVASCVGFKLFNEIKQTLEWAAKIYEQDLKDKSTNFLKKVLIEKPTIKPAYPENSKFKCFIPFAAVKHLPEAIWKEKVIEKFYIIFEELLKFELIKQEGPPVDKGEKVVHYREYYRVKSTYNVWRRKQMGKLYDAMKIDFLAKQKKITEDLMKVDKVKNKLPIIADVELMFVKCPRKVILSLHRCDDTHENFQEFGSFCIGHMGIWFMELFRMDIEETKSKTKHSAQTTTDKNDVANSTAKLSEHGTTDKNEVTNNTAKPSEQETTDKNEITHNTAKPSEQETTDEDGDDQTLNLQNDTSIDCETAKATGGISLEDNEMATDSDNAMAKSKNILEPSADFSHSNDSSTDNPPWKMLKKH